MADKFLDKVGLAYFWEKIKAYFQSQHITPPEYTIVRLANEEVGYAASYVLKKDGTQVGATINIPKDYLVRSGEVKTVTVADEPYEGAAVGDKYLDFVVNTVDDSGNTSHIYIPVSDLVDAYVAGNGIHISDNNYISVKVSQQGVDHGLGVGGDGLTVRMVTPSVNGVGGTHGAMYAADKEKLDNLEIVGVFTTGSDTVPVIEGKDGLVPAPSFNERGKFLRGDATWANPAENSKELQNAVSDPSASGTSIEFISNITQNENGEITPSKKTVRTMSASGQNHASGLVPDPGSTAGNKKFLREDGTWAEPDGGGGTPNVGNLKTNNTTAQTPSASESFTGDISLHKVSKTGSYNDLNDQPTIPSSGDFVTSLGTSGNNVTWTKNGQTNNLTVPYATKALQDGNGKTISSTYLPLSGGNMDSDATVRFSSYSTRHLTVSGNSIVHDLLLNTGGYNGSFYSIKTTGSDGEQHAFTGIGFYGNYGIGTGLKYLYIAGENDSYKNPAVKITPEGSVTFKNAITAKSFVKTGGTSSQFLKADGSVDSNTYATTSQLPSLPLSIANGGTGATTAKAAEYNINGGISEVTTAMRDNTQISMKYVTPSTTNGVFYYRNATIFWDYIKSKIASILGIGGSNGVPTAPTAAAGTNTTQIATTAFVTSATSGMAIDTNVVHKTGNETIAGVKTFNNDAMFGLGSQLKFETAQDEGSYIEAGDDNGVKTLMFADLEDDSAVRLENVAAPALGTDAANKAYVDSKGDNNLVKLNGRSGQYGVTPRSLCAFAISTSAILEIMEPFTTTGGINGKPVRQGVAFPIGCKIYYHPDYNDISANTEFTSKQFYATYDDVDARYTAVTGQNISLYSSSQSGVYLRVTVNNGYWSPYYKPNSETEIIVTPHDFQNGNFYIYLGKTVGTTGYKFQLEDNNPLYYYDGTKLVDWATYQASEAAPSYTAGDGIDITNNVISCTPRPYKKETFTPASFNASSAYSKGWQNFVASSNLEVGTYKVTLQVHLYIVSNTDNMMPAGCVVNAYMRSRATASSSYQYILGATETFSGGVLPETSIPTGRGIISKVLNVVGFMEITGDEDSGCSLEVGFTTNSSLNVMIGNTTPLDGSYAGLCSGNDFVLLEKIS